MSFNNNTLNKLPRWDLSDLYNSKKSSKVKNDQDLLRKKVNSFCKNYRGKIVNFSSEELLDAISDYERIEDLTARLGAYAYLTYVTELDNPESTKFYQELSESISAITQDLVFFTLEVNKIAEKKMAAHQKHPRLKRYSYWLSNIRKYKPHQLSEELESFIHEQQLTSRQAWQRLYDESLSRLQFNIGKQHKTLSEALNMLQSKKSDVRKNAAMALSKTFSDNLEHFAFITNTLAKDKSTIDRWRLFPSPIASRNLNNMVEDEVVNALVSSVQHHYKPLSHRYYRLKANWLGKKQLEFWDRNAPIPGGKEKRYNYNQARDLVLTAYQAFSPDMAKVAKQFFDKNWIDAAPAKGKDSGAFSHPTATSVHPYILMNFHGTTNDVMTLAHELGHGIHQVLASKQGALLADTSLTLAETASVFGEQLTFRHILAQVTDKKTKRRVLADKVEDMLNTVVRQIAFLEFETYIHEGRKKGELSIKEINQLWMGTQSRSLGPAIILRKSYEPFWCYIPHFIHTPFYVYAYAFGDALVNSLYSAFEKGVPNFKMHYLNLLQAGGSEPYSDLLKPFGLNPKDKNFWNNGLGVISKMIDELETL